MTGARIGVRLGWPIVNAATFVLRKVSDQQFAQLENAIQTIQMVISGLGMPEVAARFFVERR